MSFVLTAKVGTNADLFPDILKLYAKPGDVIADVTYGKGVFWRNVDTSLYQACFSDLSEGIDFRWLPYDDGSLDMEVIDPPYIYNPKGTVKTSLSAPYRVNETTDLGLTTVAKVVELYAAGIKEARRCIKPGGFLVVKCQDQIEANRQRWVHMDIYDHAVECGFAAEDLLVMVQTSIPASRWKHQLHARKNHSYFWVFRAVK